MRYLVTAEEMRRYDSNTTETIGIPGMTLMERAALAARDAVLETAPGNGRLRVLILAGMGNNGGDGLALARLLEEAGAEASVWCVGKETGASAQWKLQRHILNHYRVSLGTGLPTGQFDVLVDALFGVGLSREVSGEYAEAVEIFNGLHGRRISLDVPSGICSDTGRVMGCAVKADTTVTFGFAKRGLYLYPGCDYAGEVRVADIGIGTRSFMNDPPGMFCMDPREDLRVGLPPRQAGGNKGTFGKVLMIAGSAGMAGAAVLSARGAYRAGAGMVKILTPEENRIIVQQAVPEALYGTADSLEESLEWADVVAVGPGLGKSGEAYRTLERAIAYGRKPLIVDADGLNLLAEHEELSRLLADSVRKSAAIGSWPEQRQAILTPHVGELSRLTGLPLSRLKERLWDHASELSEKLGAVVVAKDARTFVCAKGQPICVNLSGNSGMATAGSGDVLTGILAGLWAQNRASEDGYAEAFRTACTGVLLHGAAGDAAAAGRSEYGCMAGDIADAAAAVIRGAFGPFGGEEKIRHTGEITG